MKVGILCENYFPTLGGEQEHIFNLRRHLESPRRRLGAGRRPHHRAARRVRHLARTARRRRTCCVRRTRSGSTAKDRRRRSRSRRRPTARCAGCSRGSASICCTSTRRWTSACPRGRWRTFDGPIVGTIHSYFTHTWKRNLIVPWYRYVMRRMTRVIAVSESARDAMARYARFDSTIIGNGVDCDAFQAGRPMPRFADGMTNILSVARLEHRNGIDVVIDAFARLARDQPALRLLLAGEGPGRAEYEAQTRRLPPSIASRVMFLGAVWDGARGSVRLGPLLRARRAQGELLDPAARSARRRPARRGAAGRRHEPRRGSLVAGGDGAIGDARGLRRRAAARAGAVDAGVRSRARGRWRGATTGAWWCRGFAASTTRRWLRRHPSSEDRMPGEEERREHRLTDGAGDDQARARAAVHARTPARRTPGTSPTRTVPATSARAAAAAARCCRPTNRRRRRRAAVVTGAISASARRPAAARSAATRD